MGVVLLGALGSMLISAMRSQPEMSKRAQNISTARWVLERMTREIRNGIAVDEATAAKVSFRTYVRRTTCGGGAPPAQRLAGDRMPGHLRLHDHRPARAREAAGRRLHAAPPTTLFSGIDNSNVFCYVPSTESDPLTCGRRIGAQADLHRHHPALPQPERPGRPDRLRRRQPAQRDPVN